MIRPDLGWCLEGDKATWGQRESRRLSFQLPAHSDGGMPASLVLVTRGEGGFVVAKQQSLPFESRRVRVVEDETWYRRKVECLWAHEHSPWYPTMMGEVCIVYHSGGRGQTMQMKSCSFETTPNVFWHSSSLSCGRSPQQCHVLFLFLFF